MQKPEILSPAGDMQCLNSAVSFGADAVFLAGSEFGMRTASKNFNEQELSAAVKLAHSRGVRVYLTCNTLPRNSEFDRLPGFLTCAADCGADAFIIADMGVLELAKKYAPGVDVHISTQAGIVNYASANAFYNMGAKRVVLARELSLDEIAEIRAKIPDDMEIECFVHGAMCVSFSGRCLISSYLTGRDANRGDCAQPCRWKYHLYEENRQGQYFPIEESDGGTYLYNSRDLCMIEHIPQLVKAGVSSFKLEGRAKSAYYVAVTTNAYRHAVLDYMRMGDSFSLKPWIKEELEKISHREYNTGFFFGGEPGQVTSNGGYIRQYDFVAVCEKGGSPCEITQRNKFSLGDTLDILPPDGIPFTAECLALFDMQGNKRHDTPHPMERLVLEIGRAVPEGSVIRRKRLDN